MKNQGTSPGETAQLLLLEGKRHILPLAAVFSVVALGALVFGLLSPKKYEAHSVILVEARNIIAPLMEGRAVTTKVSDEASVLSQAMYSRRILREILVSGGWGEQKDPREEDRALVDLAQRIKISSPQPELIKLSYEDRYPRRCYEVARKLAEIYVREGRAAKERESREAFEFIDKQVKEYAAKLAEAQAKIQAHHHGRPQHGQLQLQPKPVRKAVGVSPAELAALRAEEATLAGELEHITPEARRAIQLQDERVLQLQRELERLRTMFTEEHPDVIRVRDDLQRATNDSAAMARDDEALRAKRERLDVVRRRIAAATSSSPPAAHGPAAPEGRMDPELRSVGQDSTLTELMRRYEATREVYQDLLKRRENARVSMELEIQNRGLSLRIQEPAELPHTPTSARLMKTAGTGLVLAVLAPLGLLFALLQLDPRMRTARSIESAGVPLLVSIPYTARSSHGTRRRFLSAAGLVGIVGITYSVVFVIKMKS
jgi:polysaccharide chain length determinant protein (PEP-CTERM system associated)